MPKFIKARKPLVKKPLYKSFFIAVNPVGSKFAKALQGALKEKVVNNVYRILPARAAGRNAFVVTQRVLNKIEQFQAFTRDGVSSPGYSLSVEGIEQLESKTIFARTLVNSTGGRGIVEFEKGQPAPRAPLYTAYIPKKAEYRFHVFNGQVIDIQQKKKKREFNEDNRDTRIRNLHNGYVYTRDGVVAPDGSSALAIRAVAACGYQYGAVDMVYNEKRNQCYVLEVNSRPGIINSTCDSYAKAIIDYYGLTRKDS